MIEGRPGPRSPEPPRDRSPPRSPAGDRARWLARALPRLTSFRLLVIGMALFFVVSFAFSWLRAIEFQTTTWDQGLYQQALWSTMHGRPFYEAADVETGGYGSLLQVHTVFLFYVLAPLYGLLPSQVTLFAVQSAVVAVAAVPLYLLARDLTSSSRLGLVAAAFYLAGTPTLSSVLYDFHPEAFLPVELFTLALLWERERYSWGLLAAGVAFTTIELAPVLTFFFAIFGLMTAAAGAAVSLPRVGTESRWDRRRAYLRNWLRTPRVRASIALLVASAVAYELLVYLRVDYLIATLGTYPVPVPPSGYVIGSTPAALGLRLSNLSVGLSEKLTYWLVLLALLGFVPLLAPRALVLAVPWFGFTVFSANLAYVTLGFQYGFIAESALLVGLAYGLRAARRLLEPWFGIGASAPLHRPTGPTLGRVARRGRAALVVGLVAVLAVNLALTPLDPVMQATDGSAYRVWYPPAPGYSGVRQLAGLVPPSATVVASNNLFPLVANDVNAYSFFWTDNPNLWLPFSPSHLPKYVLTSQDRAGEVTLWLQPLLYQPSLYGVRGVVWSSGVGTVLLFENGYTGPAATFGSAPSGGGSYFGAELARGPNGLVTTATGSSYPSVVQSAPGAEGMIWTGPDGTLAPGNYSVEVSLRAAPFLDAPAPNASEPTVWIGASGFGTPPFYGGSWSWGALNTTSWASVQFNISVREPTMEFLVAGVLLDGSVRTTLNYLRIVPLGPNGSAT